MLKSMSLKDLTMFRDENLNFGSHLNVIVGENGSGKSHLLKVAYSAVMMSARAEKESGSATPTKGHIEKAMAKKLIGVFKPDYLGRLARRQQGRPRCELGFGFSPKEQDFQISFHGASKTEVVVEKLPSKWEKKVPVFLPTRELLTIYPGFVSLYENTQNQFEETWRDTSLLLGDLLAAGPREAKINALLLPIEEAMGGKVILDSSGRFYLNTQQGKIEMHLVAEGLRKLAMLARLVATGALLDKGYLFWDEPEANLNPAIIKQVAATILAIASSGIQVFIASHSLFLLRELHIRLIQSKRKLESRFFGIHTEGNSSTISQGSTFDQIGDIRALDEDLAQSERYLDADMFEQVVAAGEEARGHI